MMLTQNLTPQAAVDQLIELHAKATASLKSCLDRYFTTRQAPTADERSSFCYPELRVIYEAQGVQPSIARAFAKFQGPGRAPLGIWNLDLEPFPPRDC
jgi:AMP nucleosidase